MTAKMPLCPFCPPDEAREGEEAGDTDSWVLWPCCRARGPRASGMGGAIFLASAAGERLKAKDIQARYEISSALTRAEKAEEELRHIDAALARRPALEELPTRWGKVERACVMAGRAEKAEAERDRLRDKIEQFIHGEDHPDQYVTVEEAGRLKAERDELKAELNDMAVRSGKGQDYAGRLLTCMAQRYGERSAADAAFKENAELKAEAKRWQDKYVECSHKLYLAEAGGETEATYIPGETTWDRDVRAFYAAWLVREGGRGINVVREMALEDADFFEAERKKRRG